MSAPYRVVAVDTKTIDVVARTAAPPAGSAGLSYAARVDDVLAAAMPLWNDATISSGGCASNAIYALGRALEATDSAGVQLTWQGTAGYGLLPTLHNPLDSLRCVGVKPIVRHVPVPQAVALCLINSGTGEHHGTFVYPGPPILIEELVEADLALISLSTLRAAQGPGFLPAGDVALIIDCQMAPQAFRRLLTERVSNLRFVFCNNTEAEDLALLDQAAGSLAEAEVVVSAGPDAGRVWRSGQVQAEWHPHAPSRIRSVLGAGDSFAGTYLSQRIRHKAPDESAEIAAEHSELVLGEVATRLPVDPDLNRLFGTRIDRASRSRCERQLHRRVRQTPDFSVISGGQTGVDTIGLTVAARLGLPAFGIFPRGRRTEATGQGARPPAAIGDANLLELASSSFRYRTWANVYFADGTLLWDYRGTEGSDATRDAAAAMNRPLLDLTGIAYGDLVRILREWADAHDIRVVNVAGNRGSNLQSDEVSHVERSLYLALRILSQSARRRSGGLTRLCGKPARKAVQDSVNDVASVRLGMPLGGVADEAFSLLFPGATSSCAVAPALVWEALPQLTVGRFRARSLPQLLASGDIDAAICSGDVLSEMAAQIEVVADTHIGLTLLAEVGAGGEEGGLRREISGQIVSQYPELATFFFGGDHQEIVPIAGAAETYVKLGLATSAVDTWRTGRTASANGLSLRRPLATSSLMLVARDKNVARRLRELTDAVEDSDGLTQR